MKIKKVSLYSIILSVDQMYVIMCLLIVWMALFYLEPLILTDCKYHLGLHYCQADKDTPYLLAVLQL